MLETKQTAEFFETLQDYENFNLAWTSICARLNPTERNVARHDVLRKRGTRGTK